MSGYIIITLYFLVMFLRGLVGNGPKVLNGKWAGLNVTSTVWSLVPILLSVVTVDARGLSARGLMADLSLNMISSNVRVRVKIVLTLRKR